MKRIKWEKMGKMHTSVYSFGPLVADPEHSNGSFCGLLLVIFLSLFLLLVRDT